MRQRRSWEFRAQSSELRIGAPRLRPPHLSRVEVERWRNLVLTAVASCDTIGINSPRPAGYRRLPHLSMPIAAYRRVLPGNEASQYLARATGSRDPAPRGAGCFSSLVSCLTPSLITGGHETRDTRRERFAPGASDVAALFHLHRDLEEAVRRRGGRRPGSFIELFAPEDRVGAERLLLGQQLRLPADLHLVPRQ